MARDLTIQIGDALEITDVTNYATGLQALANLSSETHYPFSSGERIQVLDASRLHTFTKLYTGPFQDSLQHDLEVLMRTGNSLKYDIYNLAEDGETRIVDRQGVVFLMSTPEEKAGEDTKRVHYTMMESYRRILNNCDDDDSPLGDAILVTDPSGIHQADIDFEDYVEGIGSAKASGIGTGASIIFYLFPPTYFNVFPFRWAGFWFKTVWLNATRHRIRLHIDANNYWQCDFTNAIDTESRWIFVRCPLDDFEEVTANGAVDKSALVYATIVSTIPSGEPFDLRVDSLSLIE